MKLSLFLLFFCCLAQTTRAQDSSYLAFSARTREIIVGDSLALEKLTEGYRLDSMLARKYFSPILSSGNNPFKNRIYTCLGKISAHEHFDLFLVMEDRRRADSSGMVTTWLVSLKKNGDFISSQKVVITGTKKRSGYNIRSTLYKDDRLFIDTRIQTGEKLFEQEENYRISKTGRFFLAEKTQ